MGVCRPAAFFQFIKLRVKNLRDRCTIFTNQVLGHEIERCLGADRLFREITPSRCHHHQGSKILVKIFKGAVCSLSVVIKSSRISSNRRLVDIVNTHTLRYSSSNIGIRKMFAVLFVKQADIRSCHRLLFQSIRNLRSKLLGVLPLSCTINNGSIRSEDRRSNGVASSLYGVARDYAIRDSIDCLCRFTCSCAERRNLLVIRTFKITLLADHLLTSSFQSSFTIIIWVACSISFNLRDPIAIVAQLSIPLFLKCLDLRNSSINLAPPRFQHTRWLREFP